MLWSIDWVWHCTCHLEMQNPSIFNSVNIFLLILHTTVYFYGASTIYKVWKHSINLLQKNEVSRVILQRNENLPTNNIFEIRKYGLISKRIFQTKKNIGTSTDWNKCIESIQVTKSSHRAWKYWVKGLEWRLRAVLLLQSTRVQFLTPMLNRSQWPIECCRKSFASF